jgi:hypothetical protein
MWEPEVLGRLQDDSFFKSTAVDPNRLTHAGCLDNQEQRGKVIDQAGRDLARQRAGKRAGGEQALDVGGKCRRPRPGQFHKQTQARPVIAPDRPRGTPEPGEEREQTNPAPLGDDPANSDAGMAPEPREHRADAQQHDGGHGDKQTHHVQKRDKAGRSCQQWREDDHSGHRR